MFGQCTGRHGRDVWEFLKKGAPRGFQGLSGEYRARNQGSYMYINIHVYTYIYIYMCGSILMLDHIDKIPISR